MKRIQQQNQGFSNRIFGHLVAVSMSQAAETQNYMEPYADEPLADEEWLQKYRKEQEDNEDLKRELNQCLYNAVPESESRLSVFNDLFIPFESKNSEIPKVHFLTWTFKY